MDGDRLPGNGAAKPAEATYSRDVERGLYLLRRVFQSVFTFGYDTARNEFSVTRDGDAGTIRWAPTPSDIAKLIVQTWGDDL